MHELGFKREQIWILKNEIKRAFLFRVILNECRIVMNKLHLF